MKLFRRKKCAHKCSVNKIEASTAIFQLVEIDLFYLSHLLIYLLDNNLADFLGISWCQEAVGRYETSCLRMKERDTQREPDHLIEFNWQKWMK